MSRLLGYLCSDDTLTPFAMREVAQEAWPSDAEEVATLGFGWVQESRTLLRKHPSRGHDPVDVLGLLCDIPARAIVGHLQGEFDGAVDTLDLQPFRFRKWVYAQCGQVPNFGVFRDELVETIPDHIRRNIQGKTDAEVVFHKLYHWMKKQGALTGTRADGELAAAAMAETFTELEQRAQRAGHEGPIAIDAVAVTERFFVAARHDSTPLHYRIFEGLEQPGEEPLFAGHRPKAIEHPHFRAAFLASGLEPTTQDWVEVPERSVVWVDDSWEVGVAPIDELREA